MKKYWLILIAIIAIQGKCNNDQFDIPYVRVDFEINLNLPAYQNLIVPSGWIYISGGSRGIIIYRNSQDEFTAFERHSPYQAENNCAVYVEEDNITLKDECSDSQWLIIDGSILSGPTNVSLLQYNVSWADPILRIYN